MARRQAGIHGREIDEGLEGRAGLARRLDGAVELAAAVGPAARHGEHAAGLRCPSPPRRPRHWAPGAAHRSSADRAWRWRRAGGRGRPSRPRSRRPRSPRWPDGRARRRHSGWAGSAAPRPSRRRAPCRRLPVRRRRRAGRRCCADCGSTLVTTASCQPGGPESGRRWAMRANSSSQAPHVGDLGVGAAPAVAAVVGDQAVAQRLVGHRLDGRDRGWC